MAAATPANRQNSVMQTNPRYNGTWLLARCELEQWEGQAWLQLLPMLEVSPDAAAVRGFNGKRLLHYAARAEAPVEVVEVLLNENTEAVTVEPDKKAGGAEYKLPLDYAAEAQEPLVSVVELLKAEESVAGNHPLQILRVEKGNAWAEALMRMSVIEAGRPDIVHSRYPLHHAVRCNAPKDVVERILKEYPKAAIERDQLWRMPLDYATTSDIRELLKEEEQRQLPNQHCHVFRMETGDAWQKLKDDPNFGDAAAKRYDKARKLLLHYAAGRSAPLEVVEDLLKRHPEGATHLDKDKRLPLDHAGDAETRLPDVIKALKKAEIIQRQKENRPDHDLHLFRVEEGDGWLGVLNVLDELGAADSSRLTALATTQDERGKRPLHYAAEKRAPLDVVERLVAEGGANHEDKGNKLPLDYALQAKPMREDVVICLLEELWNLNEHKPQLLHEALDAGLSSVKVVEEMLKRPENYAFVESERVTGRMALHAASQQDSPQIEIIEALLNINPAAAIVPIGILLPLDYAACGLKPSKDVIKMLQEAEVDAAEKEQEDRDARYPKSSPLHVLRAVPGDEWLDGMRRAKQRLEQQNKGIETLLITQDISGRLPLHYAARARAPLEVVQKLLTSDTGSGDRHSVTVRDHFGFRALDYAMYAKAPQDVIDELRKKEREMRPASLQDLRAMNGDAWLEALKRLQAEPSIAKEEDKITGRLPVHYAAEKMAPVEVVRKLLDLNPDSATVKDKLGRLPLDHAVRNGAPWEVVHELLKRYPEGACMTDKRLQRLPLHYAVYRKAPMKILELLLKAHPEGAVAKHRNFHGSGLLLLQENLLRHLEPVEAVEPGDLLVKLLLSIFAGRRGIEQDEAGDGQKLLRGWIAVVQEPDYASVVGSVVSKHRHLAHNWKMPNGESAYDKACSECRATMDDALRFLGRYNLGYEAHRSATCVVWLAEDKLTQQQEQPSGTAIAPLVGQDQEAQERPKVALKLMQGRQQFLQEITLRVKNKESSEFVVMAIRAHVDPKADDAQEVIDEVEAMRLQHSGSSFEGVRMDSEFGSIAEPLGSCPDPYRYCLVMEQAERNLGAALAHERFAGGANWDRVRDVAGKVAKALELMHTHRMVHLDFKPLNVMRLGGQMVWKLIDLDVSCMEGDQFGYGQDSIKQPSGGYAPPEMAKLLLRSVSDEVQCLHEYKVSQSYDLWSFGCVLYHMCTNETLWHTNEDDDTQLDVLATIAALPSNPVPLKLRLKLVDTEPSTGQPKMRREATLARALLEKLLEPDADQRLKNFQTENTAGMETVLQDNFFLDPARSRPGGVEDLQSHIAELQESHKESNMLLNSMHTKLDMSLREIRTQSLLLKEIIKNVKDVPKLTVFFPVEDDLQSWVSRMRQPRQAAESLLGKRVELRFVCELTHRASEKGFPVFLTSELVRKVAPFLKTGVTILKAASAIGKIAGVPIPDVGGLLENWWGSMNMTLENARSDMEEEYGPEASAALDTMFSTMKSFVEDTAGAARDIVLEGDQEQQQSSTSSKRQEILERSAEALDAMIGESRSAWVKNTGLVKAIYTGPSSGPAGDGEMREEVVVWCLPKLEKHFEKHGPDKDIDYYLSLALKDPEVEPDEQPHNHHQPETPPREQPHNHHQPETPPRRLSEDTHPDAPLSTEISDNGELLDRLLQAVEKVESSQFKHHQEILTSISTLQQTVKAECCTIC